jgi:hypothetical protein
MTSIYEFLNAWRELITKVFGEYPLAAALMTLLAVGMFFSASDRVAARSSE